MDKTPKGKSLRFVRSNEKLPAHGHVTSNCLTSTPIKESRKPQRWESDILSIHESGQSDVMWDWDSPKNIKPKSRRTDTKQIHQSPKVAPKKISQIDHIKNSEKLREELQALRNEIARVDEDCLPSSPIDEQTLREERVKDCSDIDSFIEEQYFHIENQERESSYTPKDLIKNDSNNDLFNDFLDEQLIICTQVIEQNLLGCKNVNYGSKSENFPIEKLKMNSFQLQKNEINHSNGYDNKIKFRKVIENNISSPRSSISDVQCRSSDDSFDAVLKEFDDEEIDILTQTLNNKPESDPRRFKSNVGFKRTFSDANVQYNSQQNKKEVDLKLTFHRTHSFESSVLVTKDELPQHVIDNVERKRLEALAKLKEKKKDKCTNSPYVMSCEPSNSESPMKCSPEEIEQKRLLAKAIREAKQKEIIEKNRQEALKRLEMNRMKRLGTIKKHI